MAARGGGDAGQGGLEIAGDALDLVTFYSRNLAVPARRDIDDPQGLRGKQGVSCTSHPTHGTAVGIV